MSFLNINIEPSELIPVEVDGLTEGAAKELDIFLVPNKKAVLYKKAGVPITEKHLKELRENGISYVYIRRRDCSILIRELEEEVSKVFQKSVNIEVVKKWAGKVINLAEAILSTPTQENLKAAHRVTQKISESIEKNPQVAYLTAFVLKKDISTSVHISNVHTLSSGFAYHLGYKGKDLELIVTGSFFHDIGKVKVPDHILKKPRRLSPREFEIVKKHTLWGYEILNKFSFKRYADIALSHHEFLDGSGYPHGLKGEQIPEEARLVQICDIYEALTGIRPYRDAEPPFSALSLMKREFVEKEKIDIELYKEFVLFLHKNRK